MNCQLFLPEGSEAYNNPCGRYIFHKKKRKKEKEQQYLLKHGKMDINKTQLIPNDLHSKH